MDETNQAPNVPSQFPAPAPLASEPDTPPPRPPQFAHKAVRRKKRLILIVLGAIVLLLLASAAYWFLIVHKKAKPAQPSVHTAQGEQAATTNSSATAADATPTTYKSSKLNIEFTHRKDWTVRESADKSEVTVTSPKVTYSKADGSSTQGVFTLKLRSGTIPDGIQNTVAKSIAVRDSEVVAYDAPTDQQRQYTNITDAGKDANTFNFVIVSSGTSFKAGQPLGYGVNLTGDAYLFAGGYGEDKGNSLTFDDVSKADFATPTYDQAVAIIKSLKLH